MLLQRLRSAEPTVEAAISYNLVDLALSAPESSFVDIIRVFSAINRSANPDDPRLSNNMVCSYYLFLTKPEGVSFRFWRPKQDLHKNCIADLNSMTFT
jgi:hypothetical protein